MLIDPVEERVERDTQLITELGLHLIYTGNSENILVLAHYFLTFLCEIITANTHVHADHITGSGKIKEKWSRCKSIISKASGAKADIHVEAGELVTIGNQEIEVRPTPGHTDGCVTYVHHKACKAFTGDAVLIRGCGRTDFQQGIISRK